MVVAGLSDGELADAIVLFLFYFVTGRYGSCSGHAILVVPSRSSGPTL
jgi:hypothetical protein